VTTVPGEREASPTREVPTVTNSCATRITIVYDNHPGDAGLQADWGFSAMIERGTHAILFDTGADGGILLANLRALSFDPTSIEYVVLSHFHADHTGGLDALLDAGARPEILLSPSMPEDMKRRWRAITTVAEVQPGPLGPEGCYSTGEIAGSVAEQAVVVRHPAGLVVLTGCAHPGVARMVRQATELVAGPVQLVVGGFHLGQAGEDQIAGVLAEFERLGVQRVAPCHCTGDLAIAMFARAYGDRFVPAHVGTVIELP
jgi:7,8-dihydropterin-6-yl-methyl-4-(beta-D-ribofuranosyl)aminobenzene 5'-phosphate synthase